MDKEDYNEFIVKKGIIRYRFVIILFILCISIFHPSTFDFVKKSLSINNVNALLLIHAALFSSIVYFMLRFSDDSLIFSPCNIEIDMDDYEYYISD